MNFQDVVDGLCHEAREHGLRFKRMNASTEMTEQDRLVLEQHAKSLVVRWPATPFDPEVNMHDRVLSDAHRSRLHEHNNAKYSHLRVEAKVTLLKETLANHHLALEPHVRGGECFAIERCRVLGPDGPIVLRLEP